MKKIGILAILLIISSLNSYAQIIKHAERAAKAKAKRELSKSTKKEIDKRLKGSSKQKEEVTDVALSSSNTVTTSDTLNGASNEVIRKKSDFLPGDKPIFIDNLKRELMGEFPSKWDLDRGTVEIMEFEGQKVIGVINNNSRIFPLMKEETYLPETFTIEMDCYFHNTGNEGYYIDFNEGKERFRINKQGLQYKRDYVRTNADNLVGWRHVALSFNRRALKIYFEGERLINMPNLKSKPLKMAIQALSAGGHKGKYAMFKNVRVAEGGVPLYNRLITDGKIVTTDIHFGYDKTTLKPNSMPIIESIADLLENHPDIRLSIEGHTDGDGESTYNQELSEKRAEAVKAALVRKGVDNQRLEVKGLGESKPVSDNQTEKGKGENRRVEFVLLE